MNFTSDYTRIATIKKDKLGGIIPSSFERAQHSDLITLPDGISGTNCGNCKFITASTNQVYHCIHPDVDMAVNDRNCCKYWDAPGTIRHFSKGK